MDIRAALLTPQYQSKKVATEVANYACISEENFGQLMDCFLDPDYRLSQRSAYSLGIAARERPELAAPYVGTLVEQLARTDAHPAILRNAARILEYLDIPEEFHTQTLDICFQLIQNSEIPVAIRAFSLTVLDNLTKQYPEIANELRYIIQERIEYELPAFQSRGKRILALMSSQRKRSTAK